MSILAWIVIGLLAGFIATRITGTRGGLIRNLIFGLIGSFFGGFLASKLKIQVATDFGGELIVATVGAILFLFLWQLIWRPKG
jgi:uncharacterized membrane protein YeaQ/YmgE (transglycosylase-associated protein family)